MTAALTLDRLTVEPRPEAEVAESPTGNIPRAEMPQFVVRTQTVYLVRGAPTAARVLQWFADTSDIDLDVVTLDFGRVEVVGQVNEGEPEDVRYWPTEKGRHALAMALLFDKGPTVAETLVRSRS